jgi:hypothetical protein
MYSVKQNRNCPLSGLNYFIHFMACDSETGLQLALPARCRCGIILLSHAAIFILHILRSLADLLALIEELPELQKVVHTKR